MKATVLLSLVLAAAVYNGSQASNTTLTCRCFSSAYPIERCCRPDGSQCLEVSPTFVPGGYECRDPASPLHLCGNDLFEHEEPTCAESNATLSVSTLTIQASTIPTSTAIPTTTITSHHPTPTYFIFSCSMFGRGHKYAACYSRQTKGYESAIEFQSEFGAFICPAALPAGRCCLDPLHSGCIAAIEL